MSNATLNVDHDGDAHALKYTITICRVGERDEYIDAFIFNPDEEPTVICAVGADAYVVQNADLWEALDALGWPREKHLSSEVFEEEAEDIGEAIAHCVTRMHGARPDKGPTR